MAVLNFFEKKNIF